MKHASVNVAVGLVACAVVLAACGGEDSTPAASVESILLHVNSVNDSDIKTTGTVIKDENIGQGISSPWSNFIERATQACGAAPQRLSVSSAAVSLDTSNAGKTQAFDRVVSGEAIVFFMSTQGSDTDAAKVDVARASRLSGAGPNTMTVVASPSDLGRLRDRLLGSDFHVGFRAATLLTDKDSFSMDVRIHLSALAFCD